MSNLNIINLTPHAITIDSIGTFESSGVIRVDSIRSDAVDLNGIRVIKQTFGDVIGLPDAVYNTIHIVSALVLSALKDKGINRSDVFAPDTGADAIRNEKGHIIAVRGLVQ